MKLNEYVANIRKQREEQGMYAKGFPKGCSSADIRALKKGDLIVCVVNAPPAFRAGSIHVVEEIHENTYGIEKFPVVIVKNLNPDVQGAYFAYAETDCVKYVP